MILGTFYEVKKSPNPPTPGRCQEKKIKKRNRNSRALPPCAKEKKRRKVKETEWLLHPQLGFIRVCEALCCNPRLRNRALRASERQRNRQRETESCKYCSSDGESGGDAKQSGEGRGRSSSLLHVAYP